MPVEPNDPGVVTRRQRTELRRGEATIVVTTRMSLKALKALERYRDMNHMRSTAEACRVVLEEFAKLMESEGS